MFAFTMVNVVKDSDDDELGTGDNFGRMKVLLSGIKPVLLRILARSTSPNFIDFRGMTSSPSLRLLPRVQQY